MLVTRWTLKSTFRRKYALIMITPTYKESKERHLLVNIIRSTNIAGALNDENVNFTRGGV